jgi:hypothetical protein
MSLVYRCHTADDKRAAEKENAIAEISAMKPRSPWENRLGREVNPSTVLETSRRRG